MTTFKQFISESSDDLKTWAEKYLSFSFVLKDGAGTKHVMDWTDRERASLINKLVKFNGHTISFANNVEKVYDLRFRQHMPPAGTEWKFKPGVAYQSVHSPTSGHAFSVGFEECIINDFTTLPDCVEFLEFDGDEFGSVIKSLNGLDKLTNLRDINVSDPASVKFTCGLLPLLKHSSLKYISVSKHITSFHKSLQALKIVSMYVREKDGKTKTDIADCMDELIEAGLKEFAKL